LIYPSCASNHAYGKERLDGELSAMEQPDGSEQADALHWRPVEIVGVLALLAALQILQAVLIPGSLRDPIGLTAETARYFPTVLTAYVVLLLVWRRGMRPGALGFRRPRSWRPALYTWAAAVLVGPLYAGVLWLLGGDFTGLVAMPFLYGAIPVEALTRAPVLLWIASLVVLAPLVEEVIFRGLLFNGLRMRWPLAPALLITSLVFASFHFDEARLLPLILVGGLFAYSYERTGSLWGAIVPHAGLNAVALVVTLVRA
jgi:membrane protease YdiL (CAAX protease family)